MTEQEPEFPQSQGQPAGEARRHVSIGIDAELEARLDAYAADTGKTRSAAVRDLVKAGLVAMLARGYDAAGQGGDATAGEDADDAGQAAEAADVSEYNNNDTPGAMDSLAVSYVSEHPRATMTEIAVGLGLSRSVAIRRMQDVCAKGLAANAGTDRHPLWEVPGVEHEPEELLTERQTRVLACLRRDPAPTTAQIAAELGCAASTVNKEYRVLETRGLARRAARGRWVAVGGTWSATAVGGPHGD